MSSLFGLEQKIRQVLGNEFDVAAVFDEADLDRDGAISFHDFLAYLHQITELPSVECLDDLSEVSRSEKLPKRKRIRQALKSWLANFF